MYKNIKAKRKLTLFLTTLATFEVMAAMGYKEIKSSSSSSRQLRKRSISTEVDLFNDWKHCPDEWLNGGKPDCEYGDCDCSEDTDAGCILGICICLVDSHLALDKIKCHSMNHNSHMLSRDHKLPCPKTCWALSPSIFNVNVNSCPPHSRQNKTNGKCYCNDGSRVVPQVTTDHKLNTTVCLHAPVTLPPPTATTETFQTTPGHHPQPSVSI